MNEHILLVMKWLKNPDKYTLAELEDNYESAHAANSADAAYCAYCAYATRSAADTTYWVNDYFEGTGEDKQAYIDALGE